MKTLRASAHTLAVPFILLSVICLGMGFFVFNRVSATASQPVALTPTQEVLWARVNLVKPTHTPTNPPPLPTVMAAPTSTEAVNPLSMQLVNDAPVNPNNLELPADAPAYTGTKLILVDISEQHMYVYDADALVYSFVVSTGIGNSTRVGTFQVQSKYPNAYASTWDLWMPSWLGIYYSHGLENGIHALPILSNGATLWAGFLGSPVSYGCVVLGTYEAQILYDWADMGTTVQIQW